MDLSPETVLQNRYRIIRQLGQGGMGAVYLAFDNSLEHEVAVKLNRTRAEQASTQFISEARLLANLHHPNLPRVTDYFVVGEDQYLVMDYIPGDDLGQMIEKQGALPVEQVLGWAEQLGSALSYMHRQSPPVIHRDIKPPNIKQTLDGEVVLVDFGIAKAVDVSQATASGALGYTPGYAPPEQYGHSHTGPYSDQYALAATLYALLTGQKPVDSVQRLLGQAVLTPIHLLNPAIPEAVQAAIERAMAVKPEDRFPTVEDFISGLTSVTARSVTRLASSIGNPIDATLQNPARPGNPPPNGARPGPVSAGSRGRFPLWGWGLIAAGILFLGILIVGGGAGLYLMQNSQNVSTKTATALANEAIILPPVKTAAATRKPIGTPSATPTQRASETPVPQTGTPTLEPSAAITLEPSATITLEATAASTPIPVGGPGVIAFVSDRGDGKTQQIWTMKPALDSSGKVVAGDFKQLTTDPGDKSQPDWSPDGKKILYVAPSGNPGLGLDIFMLDLSQPGSQPVNLSKHNGDDTDPAWSPDGKLIAFTSNSRQDGILQLYMMNADGTNMQRLSYDFEEYSPSWTPKMEWLLFVIHASDNRYLYMRGVTNKYATPQAYDVGEIFGRFGQVAHPSISRDGANIAYVRVEGNATRIFTADWKGRGARTSPLTNSNKDRDPAWSPDGQWIVFTSERDGDLEVYIMTNTGLLQMDLTNRPGKDMQPAWQP